VTGTGGRKRKQLLDDLKKKRGSTRSHWVENSWKRLWTFRKTDRGGHGWQTRCCTRVYLRRQNSYTCLVLWNTATGMLQCTHTGGDTCRTALQHCAVTVHSWRQAPYYCHYCLSRSHINANRLQTTGKTIDPTGRNPSVRTLYSVHRPLICHLHQSVVSKKKVVVDVAGVIPHYYKSWRCSGKFRAGKWK
jgi:hypothetical protein